MTLPPRLSRLLDSRPDAPAHIATALWALLFAIVLLGHVRAGRTQQQAIAERVIRGLLNLDLASQEWIREMGDIYVAPPSGAPPPGAATSEPRRPEGLTRWNPESLGSSLLRAARLDPGLRVRILPEGRFPADHTLDAWESKALARLAAGASEVSEVSMTDGVRTFRHFSRRRLPANPKGAGSEAVSPAVIVIDIPMDGPALAATEHEESGHLFGVGFLGLLGLVGIQGLNLTARRHRQRTAQAFDALRAREERLRDVIQGSPDGFWLVDAQGRVQEVNDRYLLRSGYRREEVLGQPISAFEGQESPADTAAHLKQIRDRGFDRFETVHRAKDGTLWPLEAFVTYSPSDGGRSAVFMHDLSADRNAEILVRIRAQLADLAQNASLDELLQAALDRAERLTSSAIGFFHFVDPDQEHLTLQTWSTRTLRHACTAEGKGFHYPISQAGVWVDCLRQRAPVIHNDYPALPNRRGLPPGHAAVTREVVVPVLRDGKAVALMGLGNKPTPYDQADVDLISAVASMVTDLALRKKAQEELDHFFRHIPDLVGIASARGQLHRVNPSWERLLGLPGGQAPSDHLLDLVHPADRRAALGHFLRRVKGRPAQPRVTRCRGAQGVEYWIEWDVTVLAGENLVFVAGRDISERRRAEDLIGIQNRFGFALAATEDVDEALRLCLRTAIEIARLDSGGLYLRESPSGDLVLKVHHGLGTAFVTAVGRCPAGSPPEQLAAAGRPLYLRYDPGREHLHTEGVAEGLRALAVLPIQHHGQVIGSLNLASHTTDHIPLHVRSTLESLVSRIGSVVVRTEAERALRESEERLRLHFEGAHDAIFLAQGESGIITHCNRSAEKLLDRPRSEIIGQHQSWLHPREEFARYQKLFRDYLSGTIREPIEAEVIRRDGSRVLVSIAPSTTRLRHEPLVRGVFRDITDQRRAELEVRRHKAVLEAIYEHAPIMICLIRESGEIEYANRALVERFGPLPVSPDAPGAGDYFACLRAPGTPADAQPAPGPDATLSRLLARTLFAGGGQGQVEIPCTLVREGRATDLQLSASTALIPVEGQRKLLLCLEDRTATKQLEDQLQQAQKLEAIGQLAGGVAHDFNNIIGSSMMQLQLLLDTPGLDPELKAAFHDLESENRRAAALTRQLLLFSRREVAQKRHINLNEVVDGLHKMLRRLIGEHIDMRFHHAPAAAWVEADPGMLEQVLVNLSVNARDAMPKGGTLEIVLRHADITPDLARLTVEARVGRFVCLQVSDTGTGIDPEVLPRIFEPFFTTKAAGKGTGLGLATVYGIVRQHQGWIEVRSTPGSGTSFSAFLPENRPAEAVVPDHSPRRLPRGTERVLVVEDDPGLRRTAGQLLRASGYRVTEAAHGADALRAWVDAAHQFDLLFTDMVLPGGLSGVDLAETLCRTRPGTKVLLASGYSTDLVHAGGRPGPGYGFIAKPYTPATLLRAIRDCLESKSSPGDLPGPEPGAQP